MDSTSHVGNHELTIGIRRLAHRLRVEVSGPNTVENTIRYWQAILTEVNAQPPRHIVLIDRMDGESLSSDEWKSLVHSLKGTGLESIRIAHVKPDGQEQLEYCELHALEAGFVARAFYDEGQAELWLRHGELWSSSDIAVSLAGSPRS